MCEGELHLLEVLVSDFDLIILFYEQFFISVFTNLEDKASFLHFSNFFTTMEF